MNTHNQRRMWRALSALSAAVLAVSLAGCAGTSNDSEAGFEGKTIRVGVAEGSLPSVDGESGIDPETTKLILEKLGVTDIEWVPMEFSALVPSLQSGRIDMASSGLYITAERCNAVSFAEPLVFYADGMAVKQGNPLGVDTFESLADTGATVGVVTGSAEVKQVQDAGVPQSQISEFPDVTSALEALNVDRIQAFPFDNVTLGYRLLSPQFSSLEVTDPILPEINGAERPYGTAAAFPKNAAALADQFSTAQQELADEGAFDEIFAAYGLNDNTTKPSPRPTTADYCGG